MYQDRSRFAISHRYIHRCGRVEPHLQYATPEWIGNCSEISMWDPIFWQFIRAFGEQFTYDMTNWFTQFAQFNIDGVA